MTRAQRKIESRVELFDFLQAQMQTAYGELGDQQRLESESTLIKSYLFEVDLPSSVLQSHGRREQLEEFVRSLVHADEGDRQVEVHPTAEEGFFEVTYKTREIELVIYIDAGTDHRFWECFSISHSKYLDKWFHRIATREPRFDFVWLWPAFLREIQKRGKPRGFGLDYDRRRFGDKQSEDITTYLKMQIWGGSETNNLYESLSTNPQFGNKIVLSKVRMRESANGDPAEFAIQDIKFTGKFTTRGSSFDTHRGTLNFVREEYAKKVGTIEDRYRLRWSEGDKGNANLEGCAIHFVPEDFTLPVAEFSQVLFNGCMPFRLLGFVDSQSDGGAVIDAVDMHTGGTLSFEVYPDVLSVYLPEGTCGNTIIRLYTNMQHYFDKRFSVEADNGDKIF